MKAEYYLPAHPSYFDEADYSQAEIDAAILSTDRRHNGLIQNGRPNLPVKVVFLLVREPGKFVGVNFDHSDQINKADDRAVEQYTRTSSHQHQTHVGNLKDLLKTKRLGYW